MAIPSFNNTALVTRAPRQTVGGRRTRGYAEAMPGADGLFFHGHGHGGRRIRLAGLLAAGGQTAAAAHQALTGRFAQMQALADGQTVATYVGTDSRSYANCIVQSYEWAGGLRIVRGELAGDGGAYSAVRPVVANLLQLVPA